MKKLTFTLLALAFLSLSCSSNDNSDCRRCTGTVTNTGEMADWTVCNNDGSVIRANNIDGEAETSTNTLPEAVAFFESIGLECE